MSKQARYKRSECNLAFANAVIPELHEKACDFLLIIIIIMKLEEVG